MSGSCAILGARPLDLGRSLAGARAGRHPRARRAASRRSAPPAKWLPWPSSGPGSRSSRRAAGWRCPGSSTHTCTPRVPSIAASSTTCPSSCSCSTSCHRSTSVRSRLSSTARVFCSERSRCFVVGVTSILDDPIYAPEPTPETIDAVMGAYEELGVRATVTIYQPDKVEYEWFPGLRRPARARPPALRFRRERPPTAADDHRDLPRLHRALARTAPGDVCAAAFRRPRRSARARPTCLGLHALAVEHDLPFVLHVYESKVQRVAASSSTAELARSPSFATSACSTSHSCIVHAVWVDEADIADLAVVRCHGRPLAVGQPPLRQRTDALPPAARRRRADRAVHRRSDRRRHRQPLERRAPRCAVAQERGARLPRLAHSARDPGGADRPEVPARWD